MLWQKRLSNSMLTCSVLVTADCFESQHVDSQQSSGVELPSCSGTHHGHETKQGGEVQSIYVTFA